MAADMAQHVRNRGRCPLLDPTGWRTVGAQPIPRGGRSAAWCLLVRAAAVQAPLAVAGGIAHDAGIVLLRHVPWLLNRRLCLVGDATAMGRDPVHRSCL